MERERYRIDGPPRAAASLHLALAAVGLLALLAAVAWAAWANGPSPEASACRERGGRIAWTGCTVAPDRDAAAHPR